MEYFSKTDFDSSILPSTIRITTMSITFKIGSEILIDELKQIYPNPKKPFYNSISLKVPVDKENSREVHFKLFKNGSIQGAGFKTLNDINFSMNDLVTKLENNSVFCRVSDIKIIMINVNFTFPFCIRRDTFVQCLNDNNIPCFYDNCKHAAIKIPFKVEDKVKPIVIFVFQSGAVNIFGSKNHHHVHGAYLYLKGLVDKYVPTNRPKQSESPQIWFENRKNESV